MKSSVFALLTFTAALLTVSCHEDEVISNSTEPDNGSSNGMTISAVAESIGPVFTKAEMIYKFDVAWKLDDKICVRNDRKKVEFTLIDGEETTTGLFSSQESISGSVEGFYPSSIVTDGGLYWPDTLANNQTVPMYCKKNLSSTNNQTFSFGSLGSVLQIVFNTTQDDVTLRFIDIKDGSKTMSGFFKVEDNKAVITDTDKIGITIDLGESGIALGKGAHLFNISVPAGDYQDLTLIFTTTDESQCVFKNVKLNIDHNTVGRLFLTGRNFKPLALPGVFSIGENKKIRFSKGNLYTRYHSRRNAWIWDFYHEQYGCNSLNAKCVYGEWRYPEENDDEIDLFTWGYGDWSTNPTDITYITPDQFHDWSEALPKSKGTWRTLTSDEWCYLCAWDKVDSAFVQGSPRSGLVRTLCKVCGNENCIVIAPDDFKGKGEIQSSYDAASWSAAEAAGFVCLPAAGYRTYTDKRVCAVGTEVYCWSISPDPKPQSDHYNSFCVSRTYLYGGFFMAQTSSDRRMGRSVRLVTDVE